MTQAAENEKALKALSSALVGRTITSVESGLTDGEGVKSVKLVLDDGSRVRFFGNYGESMSFDFKEPNEE